MTDDVAFITTMQNRLDSIEPQLVYADWLEERGECERAETFRELARQGINPYNIVQRFNIAIKPVCEAFSQLTFTITGMVRDLAPFFTALSTHVVSTLCDIESPPPPSTSMRTIAARRLTRHVALPPKRHFGCAPETRPASAGFGVARR